MIHTCSKETAKLLVKVPQYKEIKPKEKQIKQQENFYLVYNVK